MNWTELIGFFGGLLTTGGMVPQVIRLYRLKSAHEISLSFVLFFLMGISLWLTYGVLLGLTSVVVWNAIAFVMGLAMLYAKLRWGRPAPETAKNRS